MNSVEKHIVYISIGSNLGDKLSKCRKGIAELTNHDVGALKGKSRFYKTEPVDYTDQDWFINAVVKIETSLDPFQLFNRMKQIETVAGREPDIVRFAPRVLDLDILLYDDMVIHSSDLEIPHPRMHKRRFVLQPFCDIDSRVVHPVLKKDMQYLLNNLDKKGQMVVYYKCCDY